MRFLFLTFACLQTACAGHPLLVDGQYTKSVEAYQRGDPEAAREAFPSKEQGGFITSLEKSWLDVWRGDWNPDSLQRQIETFEDRKYVSLTREASVFLAQESEEGYVPAEHEVVILHLVSAIHFGERGDREAAAVELRRAGYVLERFWDDGSLRVWLGSLWAWLGEWDQAQVDFRRAAELTKRQELMALSERVRPPRRLSLGFHGNGPITEWVDSRYTPNFLSDPPPPKEELAISTMPWFARHEQRNGALRDVLVKSNYMAQQMGDQALVMVESGVGHLAATLVRVVGVGLGAAIVVGAAAASAQSGHAYSGSASGSGEAFGQVMALGAAVGVGAWKGANSLDHDVSMNAAKSERRAAEARRNYRMVRFLPTWITLDVDRESEVIPDHARRLVLSRPSRTVVELVNRF